MNNDGACQPVLHTQQSVAFEYDDHFEQLLDELGIREVIGDDDEALRTMWNNLKVIIVPLDKYNWNFCVNYFKNDYNESDIK